ncbi:HGL060Cp [Eremothecium sinecaudum]|uniref:HGL060Cp n=1 Tax=Eremothecium sinecaudum TaxID=45286 RepID=A0A0X8HVQ9_9SACH|nr:HGL060Cp [Eremothecium sinecaudum]AMD22280.1 HGL060Cp [Eremothecium sinecaudum]
MAFRSLGIVQPLNNDGEPLGINVPGSFQMIKPEVDDNSASNEGTKLSVDDSEDESDLKRTKKGIILNPQPTDHDKDPLNWPVWRRDLALLCVGWHCFTGGGQTSMLAAGFSRLSTELNVPISSISYLVGPMMLALCVGSIVASPTAVLFGKRIVYLVGIIVFFVGSIVCATGNNFNQLLVGRIISGLGISTVESLPSATIAEIYFAHERAYRLGIYTLLLLGGKNLVPLLGSIIFEHLTTHWLFWILTIIVGVNLLLHVFFVPETFWDRTPIPSRRSLKETAIARRSLHLQASSSNIEYVNNSSGCSKPVETFSRVNGSATSSKTEETQDNAVSKFGKLAKYKSSIADSKFTSGLGLCHGRHSIDKWLMVMLRPFVLFSYPSILYASLLYAFAVVYLIMVSQVIDHGYKEAYGFSSLQVGMVYIAPFIGGCIGSLCAGTISDVIARVMARRNNGIYEPEFRLLTVLPAVVSTMAGLIGFGCSLQREDHWMVPTVFFGILGFGSSVGSTTAITFTVDSYKQYAQEALVTLNMFKNLIGFAFSFFNAKLNESSGHDKAFTYYALIELVIGLLVIPMYRWGKVSRAWTTEKSLLQFSYNTRTD